MAYRDKEKDRARSRAYYAAHREAQRARQRAYDAAHREEKRARRRAYYAAHCEEKRAYDAAHREEQLAYFRSYRAAHREEKRGYNRVHRARVPFVTYVYRDDDAVVYVGSGRSSRPSAHSKRSEWWTPDLTLEIIEQPSQAHARRDEYDLLIKYAEAGHPLQNKDGMLGFARENKL